MRLAASALLGLLVILPPGTFRAIDRVVSGQPRTSSHAPGPKRETTTIVPSEFPLKAVKLVSSASSSYLVQVHEPANHVDLTLSPPQSPLFAHHSPREALFVLRFLRQ